MSYRYRFDIVELSATQGHLEEMSKAGWRVHTFTTLCQVKDSVMFAEAHILFESVEAVCAD